MKLNAYQQFILSQWLKPGNQNQYVTREMKDLLRTMLLAKR